MKIRIQYAATSDDTIVADFYSLRTSKPCSIQEDVIPYRNARSFVVSPGRDCVHGPVNQHVRTYGNFPGSLYRKLTYHLEIPAYFNPPP